MEPEGSLPHSQQPATCPYTEPAQSSSCPPSHFPKILLNILINIQYYIIYLFLVSAWLQNSSRNM
jgi:hypothetical protein